MLGVKGRTLLQGAGAGVGAAKEPVQSSEVPVKVEDAVTKVPATVVSVS